MKAKSDATFPLLLMFGGIFVGGIGLITDNTPCVLMGLIIIMFAMLFGLGLEILDIKSRLKKIENKE